MAAVVFDSREVQRMLSALPEELRDKTATMALNKTADKAKTEMKRQIAAVYNLKSAEIAGALHTTKASAAKNVMSATLYPTSLSGSRTGRAMNVIHFLEKSTTLAQAKKRAKAGTLQDLFFKFKKSGSKKSIGREGNKSAPFIGNQGRTVFRRVGPNRLDIEPVQVIDPRQMFNTAALNQAVLEKAAEDLLVETQRAVDLMLSRLNT